MTKQKLLHYLRYPQSGAPVVVTVERALVDDFFNIKIEPNYEAFKHKVGPVTNALQLAEVLRNAMSAATEAHMHLSGSELAQRIKLIRGETIPCCPLPVKISTVDIIDGRATLVEVSENLEALIVDVALLHMTAETRCRVCGTAIPKRFELCEVHGTRNARRERAGLPPIVRRKQNTIYRSGALSRLWVV